MTNPFIERAANELARVSLDSALSMDPHRAMANRLEEASLLTRPVATVFAPLPVQVRRAGLMAELDVASLVRCLLVALADQSAEDPEGVAEELAEISALSDSARAEHTLDGRGHAEHARDEKLDDLIERLGGSGMLLTRQNAWDLAQVLLQFAGARIPRQGRAEGEAAA